jgi:hypothetical protein
MKRTLKFLHEIGSIGVIGALAAHLVLIVSARHMSLVQYAAVRMCILNMSKWVLLPALTICLITGVLAMAVTPAYQNAGWAWIKALLGVSMLEGTLGAVQATARDAAELSNRALAGDGDAVGMADVLRHEWGGLWTIMVLSVLNVALAIWRPRLTRKTVAVAAPPGQALAAAEPAHVDEAARDEVVKDVPLR